MLKIKDDVDLKELLKYGFEYIKNKNYPSLSTEEFVYSYQNVIFIYENTRYIKIEYWGCESELMLFDLIKADLVEKV